MGKPITVDNKKYAFEFSMGGKTYELTPKEAILEGTVTHAEVYKIKDEFGFKSGYVFIMGEKDD
jgi:imidazolonepropionase-like amidohydrolase